MAKEPVSREENFIAISLGMARVVACTLFGGISLFVALVGVFADSSSWFIVGSLGILITGFCCITVVKRLTVSLLSYGEYLARLHSQPPALLEPPKDTPNPQP
jgi:hypothetical protein